MSEDIIKPIDVMTVDELISVLTVKKDNFNDDYRNKVVDELTKRGVNLEEKFKIAKYKLNIQETEKVDVAEAYEKISLLKEPLDVIYFINYMNEHFAIQKNEDVFVVHHHTPKIGFSSFFLDDETQLKNSLHNFLSLNEWLPEGAEIIDHWETFVESTSSDYILRVAKMLDEINIDYCINSAQMIRFSSFNSPYSIVLPAEEMTKAEEVLAVIDKLKENLHEKLEAAEKSEDIDLQLELLTNLESVTPEDPVMYYNKAQLLDEKGDYQNASDALIESFNLEMTNGAVDDIEDIENYLVEILDKVGSKSNILHCLATIFAFKGDVENSFEYCKKIIDLDENDSIAHLHLGHHYYSHTEDDEKVKDHFKKFIELEPESEERESIEEILKNLG
jgi:tetratricopeptide (TPR) repeat protein